MLRVRGATHTTTSFVLPPKQIFYTAHRDPGYGRQRARDQPGFSRFLLISLLIFSPISQYYRPSKAYVAIYRISSRYRP